MNEAKSPMSVVRENLPVIMIAMVVVGVGTVVGGIFTKRSPVAADEKAAPAVEAVASGSTQTLTFKDWGVQVPAPLASEMSLVSYAASTPDTVSLSSAALTKLGPQCGVGRAALGTLTRYTPGAYKASLKPGVGSNLVATVAGYDYVYEFPQTSCTDTSAGFTTVNREESVLLEALGSLSVTQ